MTRELRLPASIALALAGLFIPQARGAPYVMVTSHEGTPGRVRVWEVSESGVITQVQDFSEPVGYGVAFEMDPFGRFLISPGGDTHLTMYSVTNQKRLVYSNTYSRTAGWQIFSEEHTLTPDGSFYVSVTRYTPPTPDEWYFEALEVQPDLTLQQAPSRWQRVAGDALTSPHEFGSARLATGNYRLFFTSRASGIAHVAVMPMSASGEISSPEQWFDFNAQPIAGGFTTRVDQRVVVVGAYDVPTAISLSVSPEGEVALVDVWSFAHDGVWIGQGVRLLPSGDRMVAGGRIATAAIEASGEFAGSALAGPYGSIDAAHPGVSPDGRIAVTTWDVDGQGIHWGVFALTPGRGPVLLRDHVLPFGYADIAFIPPRTEEMLGDANGDGLRDAADVVTYINHLADDPGVGGPLDPTITGPVPRARADADQDGDIDADDLAWLVGFLVGGETP